MIRHPAVLKDFYKVDHRRQYPEGTEFVFTNFTARKSRIPGINHMVFFGLQYFVKEYLIKDWNENFFSQNKEVVLAKYKRRIDNALGKDTVPIDHLARLHDHGKLPIHIMALPEGSRVPIGVPPFVIFNTQDWAFWLPNYLETIMSCIIWQPFTNATIANEYRKMFTRFALETGCDPLFTQFQGHDFSFRGMPGLEAACTSGAAHLLSFVGTDTIPAIDFLEEYYGANSDKELIGCSVPATEHSVMCMGTQDGELETISRLMDLYPKGILSVVSDTWDYWKVLTQILPVLKAQIMARDGKLVIRPDSSPKTPYEILVGDPDAPVGSPEYKGTVEVLWDLFGGVTNAAGFKVLDQHIGTIYGDSITLELATRINEGLKAKGFASINWVAGIGSYTYQYNTRDTLGSALKATFGRVNGEDREIFKNPKTDNGTKKSAKGLIAVHRKGDGTFFKKDQTTWEDVQNCALESVFKDGELKRDHTLSEIRQRLA